MREIGARKEFVAGTMLNANAIKREEILLWQNEMGKIQGMEILAIFK